MIVRSRWTLWHVLGGGTALLAYLLICVVHAAWSAPAAMYDVTDLGEGSWVMGLTPEGIAVGSQAGKPTLFTPTAMPLGLPPVGEAFFSVSGIAYASLNGVTVGAGAAGPHGEYWHAFRFVGGVMTDLGTGGDPNSVSIARGLNATTIVGVAANGPANGPAVWDQLGQAPMRFLPTLGGTGGYATAINTAGLIVGQSQTASGASHATLWVMGLPTDLDTTGSAFSSSDARAINDSNAIVGQAFFPSSYSFHAFLWTPQTGMTDLGTLPGDWGSEALGLNNAGMIVGTSRAINLGRAVLWDHGQPVNLNTRIEEPGVVLEHAFAINDHGVIAAVGKLNGVNQSFLLTPTTPPAITITATPDTMWPPNGKMVPVTIAGTITDADSGVDPSAATYTVMDEYKLVQPQGSFIPAANGSYAFTIHLQASRHGSDKDGRQYTITVRAEDLAGNEGSAATSVIVPHN